LKIPPLLSVTPQTKTLHQARVFYGATKVAKQVVRDVGCPTNRRAPNQ